MSSQGLHLWCCVVRPPSHTSIRGANYSCPALLRFHWLVWHATSEWKFHWLFNLQTVFYMARSRDRTQRVMSWKREQEKRPARADARIRGWGHVKASAVKEEKKHFGGTRQLHRQSLSTAWMSPCSFQPYSTITTRAMASIASVSSELHVLALLTWSWSALMAVEPLALLDHSLL